MQKIRDYVDRFFKSKPENKNYSLTTNEMLAFMNEVSGADGNGLFYAISALFRYGYAKGYRACKAEQKKARKAA